MTEGGPAGKADDAELDAIAWQFLCSQYTRRDYWDWPLDKRLDAFLRHRGRGDILKDGAAYNVVLDRVMANLGRARRNGVLAPPNT